MTIQPVDAAVAGFFSRRPELARAVRDAPLAVAFSGGPDSTALLRALRVGAPRFGWKPVAVHVDHRLDDGSAQRARAAGRIAERLGVPFQVHVARSLPPGRSLEEWARAERYRLLAAVARSLEAEAVLTAHHRLDQAETVLLRILFGSGTAGLGAMRPVSNRLGLPLLRPLLALEPGSLRAYAALGGIEPVDDPTNRDAGPRRNFVRRRLFPVLAAETPDLGDRLVRLARAARRAEPTVRRLLDEALAPRFGDQSCDVDVESLTRLPASLWPAALARLHRLAGAAYPPTRNARRELARQLDRRRSRGRSVGCDCGGGWRWEQSRDRLRVLRPPLRENQGIGSLEVGGRE
ncbi:MAG: tRNA lysidine(34) synthetase TilS [Holophagales bacterium]|nr:tRNA lysidine(34) synthetase TilS [Holophagales bacterium]MYD23949.1 tRNA lysidine(34) synthetase TilS [Holophagales bacterium]MYI33498.1 tRNA lysidine(34) synthetase TilS [Holophagales bacterium]